MVGWDLGDRMEAGAQQQTAPRRRKLLIVDDDPAVNETLSIIFTKQGYEVSRAHTGKEALEFISHTCPDIVLLDVVLPDISGVDIAIAIIREFPKCKFLLISGNKATENAIDDARDKGYDFEVLAKPLPPQELIYAVNSAVRNLE